MRTILQKSVMYLEVQSFQGFPTQLPPAHRLTYDDVLLLDFSSKSTWGIVNRLNRSRFSLRIFATVSGSA